MDISQIVKKQREYFESGATLPVATRIAALKKLYSVINENERRILEALKADLNKAETEAYMTEVGLVLNELRYVLRHVKRWAARRRVSTPLAQFRSSSFIYAEPFGTALIIAPWNYPFLLSVGPLIGAVAAGCCATLKPSAYSPSVSSLLAKIIGQVFPLEYVAVIEGGRKRNAELLDQKFDYIFFTGSTEVGRLVMEKAARRLTPVSLELGGKSPAIIDNTANIAVAARRVAFGKCINAGQTCVAPDYAYVHFSVKDEFIRQYKRAVMEFFPNGDFSEMPRIVNQKHYDRIMGLMEGAEYACEPNYAMPPADAETRFIPPMLIPDADWSIPAMREELFAPILPILGFQSNESVIRQISERPRPLALYLFTGDKAVEREYLSRIRFGGGCINDTIIQLASDKLPFGGIGESGMGSYHGKKSFDAFTHYKSIVRKAAWPDLKMRYHPYTAQKFDVIKKLL